MKIVYENIKNMDIFLNFWKINRAPDLSTLQFENASLNILFIYENY